MQKKKYLLFLMFLISIAFSNAQGHYPFYNYIYNPKLINPAFTGFYESPMISAAGARSFFPNDRFNRTSFLLSAETYLEKKQIGLGFIAERVGYYQYFQNQISFIASQRYATGANSSISLAIQLSPIIYNLNGDAYSNFNCFECFGEKVSFGIGGGAGMVYKRKELFAGIAYKNRDFTWNEEPFDNAYFQEVNVSIGNTFKSQNFEYELSLFFARNTRRYAGWNFNQFGEIHYQYNRADLNNKFIIMEKYIIAIQPSVNSYFDIFTSMLSAGLQIKNRLQLIGGVNFVIANINGYNTRQLINRVEVSANMKF